MKRAILLVLLCAGCGGGGDSFKNSLTFGTGLDGTGFGLLGEASTFSLAQTGGTIWFRFESAADFDGRFVRLYLYSGTYPYAQDDFVPTQKNGHILLSSFRATDPDTYSVKSYLVETIIDIGKEDHVIDAPLTITQ